MFARLTRWWWTVAGIVLIIWALQIYPAVNQVPATAAAVVIFGLWGLGTVLASLTPALVARGDEGESAGLGSVPSTRFGRALRRWSQVGGAPYFAEVMAWATAVMVVLALFVWAYTQVRFSPGYGTDELAFNQYAAVLANHGLNPYTHSMAPSFGLFRVSPNGYTFNLNGTPVTSFSYPSLSFQVYQPLLALGLTVQTAVIVNVAAWATAILSLFALLPRSIRPAALVVGSLSTYVGFAVGGVTDAVYVPLLIFAAYHWYRFSSQRGPCAWIGPVLFGLAMAMKQTPWFILPFVLAGIAGQVRIERGRWGIATASRYLGIALLAFLVPNAIYIIHSPSAWLSGVLTPFSSHTVPAGQGLVGLTLFLRLGGGSLTAYTATAAVTFVVLWLIYVTSFPRLRTWTFVVPALALFFATRSFSSYLVILLPLGLLAAATDDDVGISELTVDESAAVEPGGARVVVRSQRRGTGPWRYWPALASAGLVLVVVFVVIAVSVSAPLSVKITGVRTTGQLGTVDRIRVDVHDNSSRSLTPAFTVMSEGVISAFWTTGHKIAPLRAHGSESLTLLSPNFGAQPPLSVGFAVTAFTQEPATVSSSADFLPTQWHVGLTPSGVSAPVSLGAPVTLHAQILDQLNRPVHVHNVAIFMSQIIYSQQGLAYGSASINGQAPGTTPVLGVTGPSGSTNFVIRVYQVPNRSDLLPSQLVRGARGLYLREFRDRAHPVLECRDSIYWLSGVMVHPVITSAPSIAVASILTV